jgi:AraC family transcriptional regulator
MHQEMLNTIALSKRLGGVFMDWVTGIQNALHYIEDNITEELDYAEISKRAYVSSFHFQRVFSILCGYTLGDYIRSRRLALAGAELTTGKSKVIDIALKYGYDSPDSFTKAFTRFHGVTPTGAKKEGAVLKSYAPVKINLTLKGGITMDYKIEEKEAFTVLASIRDFNYDTSYVEIPKFWGEHFGSENSKHICGMFGICFENNEDTKTFRYMIADTFEPGGEVPDGLVLKTFPAGMYAVFPCYGAIPKAIQDVNTKIWSEWVPNCREYKIAGDYNIEMYTGPDTSCPDHYSEIWLPIVKV